MPTLIYWITAYDNRRGEYLVIEVIANDERPARVIGRFDDLAGAEREVASWTSLAAEMAA